MMISSTDDDQQHVEDGAQQRERERERATQGGTRVLPSRIRLREAFRNATMLHWANTTTTQPQCLFDLLWLFFYSYFLLV
jgi:hypothetical protein